jgi:hypothetical protein
VQEGSPDIFSKLGSYAWLAAAILSCETLNVIKMGHGEFTAPFPRVVVWCWSLLGGITAIVLLACQVRLWRRRPALGREKAE